MIRPVLRMGDPVLYQRAEPVAQFNTPELAQLLRDMDDTMRSKQDDRAPRGTR